VLCDWTMWAVARDHTHRCSTHHRVHGNQALHLAPRAELDAAGRSPSRRSPACSCPTTYPWWRSSRISFAHG